MAQSPLKVDQLQIEPSSGEILTISRDTTGSILFTDPTFGTVTLANALGLQSISNVSVVGKSETGSTHLTIQEALDASPADISATNPYLIIVTSGTYEEDIVISQGNVILYALGKVIVKGATGISTIQITEDTSPIEYVRIQGFHIENNFESQVCLDIVGGSGSTLGSDKIEIVDCHFVTTELTSHPIQAVAMENLVVSGGSMTACKADSIARFKEIASLLVENVVDMTAILFTYNTTSDLPNTVGSSYTLRGGNFNSNSLVPNTITTDIIGDGEIHISDIGNIGNVSLGGDRAHTFTNCKIGNITNTGSLVLVLSNCIRGLATGYGTLRESKAFGTVTFANQSSAIYSFGVDQPDLNYLVLIENNRGPSINDVAFCSKGITSMSIDFANPVSTVVSFVILRDM